MTEYRLISSDSHVTMPDDAWQVYLDPEFRDLAPRIEHTEEGDFRVFEGQRSPIMALGNLAGKKPEEYTLNIRRFNEQRPGAWDPAERIKDQDIDGVDAEVLYVGGPLLTSDAALRLNSVRGYNRWLSEYCSYAPGRLLGMAAIPVDTPERAAEEIRFAASQPGLAGGYIPLFPSEGDYGDERWNPLWEAFLESGMPIGMHVGGRRPGTAPPSPFATAQRSMSASQFITTCVMTKFTMAEAFSELIHGLVMQRYPDLRFIAVEGQIGWISFFNYYSDHLWEKHRYWTKSELREEPSFYFGRQVFATFMEDPVGLRERHHIGIDNIMWASDYPHSETTWPNSKSLTDEWFTTYGEDDKAKILWKNCARLFDLA
jgi:predicted TIM-barrel fold metal-dependent hydrolase